MSSCHPSPSIIRSFLPDGTSTHQAEGCATPHAEGCSPQQETDWWNNWKTLTSKLRSATLFKAPDAELQKMLKDLLALYSSSITVSTIDEAVCIMSGYECSPLEAAFIWLGRWRPTSAIVLVYSTMGIEFQKVMREGHTSFDQLSPTSSLSEKQLAGLTALHKHARQAEADLSEQLATLQMLLVDQNMVTALHLGEADINFSDLSKANQILDVKLLDLQKLLVEADNLRLQTLNDILDLLTPVQAAACSVAAFELISAVRRLGQDNQKRT